MSKCIRLKTRADNFSYGLAVSLDTRAQRKSLCNRFKLYPIYVIDFPPFAKRTFIFSHPPLNPFEGSISVWLTLVFGIETNHGLK